MINGSPPCRVISPLSLTDKSRNATPWLMEVDDYNDACVTMIIASHRQRAGHEIDKNSISSSAPGGAQAAWVTTLSMTFLTQGHISMYSRAASQSVGRYFRIQ